MATYIEPYTCPEPFIIEDPCTISEYYVYRIVTWDETGPLTIIARFPDFTLRWLKDGEYLIV